VCSSAVAPEGADAKERKGREMKRFCSLVQRLISPRLRFLAPASAAVLSFWVVGCVPYQRFHEVTQENSRLKTAHDDLVQRYNRALQDILRLQKDGSSSDGLRQKLANLEALNSDLQAKLAEAVRGTPFTAADLQKLPRDSGAVLEGAGISLNELVLFNPGEATLKNQKAGQVLDAFASLLKNEHPNEIVHLTGHTDSDPLVKTLKIFGTNPNLGYQRAYTVFKFFLERGIPENRMILHSMGYLKPVDTNETKDGKARNRRVVIELGGTKI
jgi:outer membrane protein OmpA-like peptidoglycan-associated protein